MLKKTHKGDKSTISILMTLSNTECVLKTQLKTKLVIKARKFVFKYIMSKCGSLNEVLNWPRSFWWSIFNKKCEFFPQLLPDLLSISYIFFFWFMLNWSCLLISMFKMSRGRIHTAYLSFNLHWKIDLVIIE